jgi:hypothetical protein
MNKYGPKAQQTIEKTMKKFGEGKLKSGQSGQKVTDRKQALAIGISEARAKHYKTPGQ